MKTSILAVSNPSLLDAKILTSFQEHRLDVVFRSLDDLGSDDFNTHALVLVDCRVIGPQSLASRFGFDGPVRGLIFLLPAAADKTLELDCEALGLGCFRLDIEPERLAHRLAGLVDLRCGGVDEAQALCLERNRLVSEVRQLQQGLAATKAAAVAGERSREEFLTTMNHEIRTPMNAIFGMAELLKAQITTAAGTEYLRVLMDSAQMLLKILDDILDLADMEAGAEVDSTEFNLRLLVEDQVDGVFDRARQKQLDITLLFDHDIHVSMLGDPLLLSRVLKNMFDNAVKFTKKGRVLIEVTRLKRTSHLERIGFRVSDTGIGINPTQISLLFHPFVQVDSSINRRYGGTGLGLAISDRIIRAMGGEFQVKSEPDQGTSFYFELEFEVGDKSRNYGEPEFDEVVVNRVLVISPYNGLDLELAEFFQPRTVEVCHYRDITEMNLALPESRVFDLVLVDVNSRFDFIEQYHAVRRSLEGEPAIILLKPSTLDLSDSRDRSIGIKWMNLPLRRSVFINTVKDACGPSMGKEDDGAVICGVEAKGSGEKWLRRVLVAEDHLQNQIVLSTFLDELGYAHDMAGNGSEALELFEKNGDYDLVLMDCQMPVMDGFEAARRIRRLSAEVPIVALSAAVERETQARCLDVGMTSFLAKPVRFAPFGDVLERFNQVAMTRRGISQKG